MGEEIRTDYFSAEDFREFSDRLKLETGLLRDYFRNGMFGRQSSAVGFELEGWLVDRLGLPCPVNESFLKYLDHPNVVPELSRFNVEFNSTPHPFGKTVFKELRQELNAIALRCRRCAEQLGINILFIGILPTLKPEMLTLDRISPLHRYSALNDQILRLRGGRPFHLDIEGRDHLVLSHGDVMLESATTSLQIHLQVEGERSVRVYNAALLASAPMVALAANSPFLFQKDLWAETRIPLFEQAVDLEGIEKTDSPSLARVSFGSGYCRESLFECFEENLENFPVLLPTLVDAPPGELRHLRLHNGTIWRWNRPIVDVDAQGGCSIRIEHRVPASGPSSSDIIAHIAFFVGLMEELSRASPAPETRLPFAAARENFYRAARLGLPANIQWLDGETIALSDLLGKRLIPLAAAGLKRIGVERSEIDFLLRDILEERVRNSQNGCAWQRRFLSRNPMDFISLTQTYLSNQANDIPVHLWE